MDTTGQPKEARKAETSLEGTSENGMAEEGRAAKRQKLDEQAVALAEEDEGEAEQEQVEQEIQAGPTDLYLDTINRPLLDFDFEKLCSVTLGNINIYGCLVCGKFFQGRGKKSPAYAHSLNEDHHVYIHTESLKVFILPDLYEVNDPSLEDIRYLLAPSFTPSILKSLPYGQTLSYDLQKTEYLPGFIGLQNIKHNSHMNVILQALLHVLPLRDYFIDSSQTGKFENRSELVKRLGMLYRKYWNPRNFKAQVSPHEFLQEVSAASAKKFRITEAGDPLDFLNWLLNALHRDLGGSKKARSSVIYSAFQGSLQVQDQAVLIKNSETYDKPRFDLDREIKSTNSPFLLLSIDLPPPPVFQDAIEKNIIPQVPISAVLAKYDGKTSQEIPGMGLRRFKITDLPPLLILHFKRFTANNFVEEKNPTIVNYPLRGIDLKDYVNDTSPKHSTLYDLVANITHESAAGTAREDTTWKVHVHTKAENGQDERWYQIQDLIVEEINKQVVFLGDTYIQIWERRLPPDEQHDLSINPAVSKKAITTTRALAAKQAPATEGPLAPQKSKVGIRMPKTRVEKGDSGGFEL